MGGFSAFQDWITVSGRNSSDTVIQSESDWLDAESYSDVAVMCQVTKFSTGVTIAVQTAPAEDDSLFQTMATFAPTNAGITEQVVRYATASVPLARLIRWKAVGASSAWSVTFRLLVILKSE